MSIRKAIENCVYLLSLLNEGLCEDLIVQDYGPWTRKRAHYETMMSRAFAVGRMAPQYRTSLDGSVVKENGL